MFKPATLLLVAMTILALSVNVMFANVSNDKCFFEKQINNEMRSDIYGFLLKVPQNAGQKKALDRLLEREDCKNILLFVSNAFSIQNIEKLSHTENVFLFFSVLDMISYNNAMENSYSNWYFSKLFTLAKNNPELYMNAFLMFSIKSKSSYFSEWFADPLTYLISNNPKQFAKSLGNAKEANIICGILETGNHEENIISMEILNNYNQANNNIYVTKLIECYLEGK